MMTTNNRNSLGLAGMSLLASASLLQAQTIIDVSFPDGTGTNPLFLEIDNGVGDNNMWTQETGIISTSGAANSTGGAASDATIDFTALGSESLTLNVEVSSVTGTILANGLFIGFQRRINDGTGPDLWNNLATSFGLVIAGNGAGLNGTLGVGVGGNAGAGRYQASDYGVASVASLQDGFGMTLTVSSAGWEVVITGLEDDAATAITGGSGTWDTSLGLNAWEDFPSDMRFGTSYQTSSAAGDLSFSSVNLVQGPAGGSSDLEILSLVRVLDVDDPGVTLTWASLPDASYSVEYSTNLEDWPEATDSVITDGGTASFTHSFLPLNPELQNAPKLFYRIRLNP